MTNGVQTVEKQRMHTVAICGNPNSGKTTIFNALTGLNQQVGNYPGVTVERVAGQFTLDNGSKCRLVDIPGAYSLAPFSPDEFIAASALFGSLKGSQKADAIICVIDATNLERGLYFLTQVMQIGQPVIVALNMIDLAQRKGINIDADRLSRTLGGIPVIAVVGSRGRGMAELRRAISKSVEQPFCSVVQRYDQTTEELVRRLMQFSSNGHLSRAEYIRIIFDINSPLEENFLAQAGPDGIAALSAGRQQLISQHGTLSAAETVHLTNHASRIFNEVTSTEPTRRLTTSDKIDRFILHPLLGPIILAAMMIFVFQSIFSWAEPFMSVIDASFAFLGSLVENAMVDGPLRSLLVDGIIGGVGSVLIFIPQIAILFVFITILEDSGYMSRAAFIVDRMFRWCGLSGKSFIPMLSSFACAVPGIMATRTIEDRKLRFITIMVAPLMTCSARLPVYSIMIAAFIPYQVFFGVFNLQGLVLATLYLVGVVVAVIVSFFLNRLLLKTDRGTFLMEMPSYKIPTFKSVVIRVFNRLKSFVIRAGTVIMAITIIIWALSYYPRSTEMLERQNSEEVALVAQQESQVTLSDDMKQTQLTELNNLHAGERLRNSFFGKIGHVVEPLFVPLGWDWRITMSVLASFPAREVIIATIGTIFNLGTDVDAESASLVERMRQATWESGDKIGQRLFSPAVALSIMIFFALCCQCGATLVTIKQETQSWRYPVFVFTYMTTLAYIAALAAYQIFAAAGW